MATATVGTGRDRIELTFGTDAAGMRYGEAYFVKDDMCAPIINDMFCHPYTGLKYRLFICNGQVSLDVQVWQAAGNAVIVN